MPPRPADAAAFWNQPLAAALANAGATAGGLASPEADRRLRQHGPNNAAEVHRPPAWRRFAGRFANPLILILLAASALSAVAGDLASFAIVVTIVLLSVLLDVVQEGRAQDAVAALQGKVALRAEVRRDGAVVTLPFTALVPGDVVLLTAGDVVPADGRLLAGRDLVVNQALLTGESYPVEKAAADLPTPVAEAGDAANAVLAGTSVVSGDAAMLVCRTGRATALGGLAGALAAPPPPTAFEAGLRRFSGLILRITAVLVLLVLAESLAFHRPWLQSLMFALALAVGLTPELLPMIVTVTLAHGATRLARHGVVVKRLPAIHNLGAMDVLCTDKTGTLTEARISLVRQEGVRQEGVQPDGAGPGSARVLELAFLNSHFETGRRSPLDEAILAHASPDGLDLGAWRRIDEVPFDFERRRVSVLLEQQGTGGRTLIVKGAPEDLLRLSTQADTPDGPAPMTPALRAALTQRFEAIGADGMRALGLATRAMPAGQEGAAVADEAGLTFAGFAVFLDPPKASAGPALRALAAAGVAVKVLTGDGERVARHVCAELGLPEPDGVTGAELAGMDDAALLARVERADLFCRVTPQQKLRVLLALKRAGRTVGYLGDGINDAPALHAADVGISVDGGADVAKAAAPVILMQPDLGVLHEGVVEGRRTVVNVDKYILMAGSANLGNIFSMVLAGLVLPFLPLLPIQVLLTNLVYDLAQMGLPLDRVDPERVAQPVHWDIRLIRRFMLVMTPVSTLFDMLTFGLLILLFHAGEELFRTGWFVESLVTQILMIFAVRTRRRLFASRPGLGVAVLAVGAVAFTLALPVLPFGAWFGLVVPPAGYFAALLPVAAGFLVVTELAKRLFYARLLGEQPVAVRPSALAVPAAT